MIKLLKKLKDIIDPNYWATKIGDKSGLYDKAEKSSIRKWALGLEGWKWWAWQIGGGLIGLVIVEFLLNKVGMTILPWR
jgi:hypothetical protein|tara:strand:+ start:438 stop:674 length:237 start_codon:yes stop_codon:yes gene_type:complete